MDKNDPKFLEWLKDHPDINPDDVELVSFFEDYGDLIMVILKAPHSEDVNPPPPKQPELHHRIEDFESLDCDLCGARLGYVYPFDLEGSEFLCGDCYRKQGGKE